jgi:radical SAM-linked protein
MRLLQRALRRSGLPLAFSQGFNPRLRLNLALPLPLGVTAGREFGELYLSEQVKPALFVAVINPQLPEGLKLLGAEAAEDDTPSLAARVAAARYRAKLKPLSGFSVDKELIRAAINDLLEADEILSPRTNKKKKEVSYTNIRPYIFELALSGGNEETVLLMLVKAGSDGGVSPSFLLQKIGEKGLITTGGQFYWDIEREGLYALREGAFVPLTEGV